MKLEDFVLRADELLVRAQHVGATMQKAQFGGWVDAGQFAGLRSAILSFLLKTFGERHPYYLEVAKIEGHDDTDFGKAREVLVAAKDEVEGGWLRTTKGLVAAEIFSDFVDMAAYLLSSGYKDAAAVIVGSVLEEHLRQLALANSIPVLLEKDGDFVPKKADRLNAELAGAGVYSVLDQKSVTAWLDLRNKAAHGKYSEFERAQVDLMLRGITEFMARVTL